MITATPESIALAAGLIGQTKGDLAQARRAAGEAFAWLQSIDPSYKPEPVKAPEVQPGETQPELVAKLHAAEVLVSRASDRIVELADELAKSQADQDAERTIYRKRIADLERQVAAQEVRIATAAIPAAPIAAPQPAPQAPIKANPAPTPAAQAADPYAGLPPKMRAFLATQASKLEID